MPLGDTVCFLYYLLKTIDPERPPKSYLGYSRAVTVDAENIESSYISLYTMPIINTSVFLNFVIILANVQGIEP